MSSLTLSEKIINYAYSGSDPSELTRLDSTGWADYVDTQYTEAEPFELAATTDTVLPNNAGTVRNSQLPPDVTSFYVDNKIVGFNGDSLLITIDFKAKPTNSNTTYLEVWMDIGGSVGELYKRIVSFPKGNNVERPINFTTAVYTLDTWEANGATVYVRANNTADIYDIRYVVFRTHKAR